MNNSPDELFATFWQAGYEGADHINRAQKPLSMNQSTGHLTQVFDDYLLLQQFGIRTVRESIGWRLTEINNEFDFSSIEPRARAAQQLGIQICWTFCHYGWPEDIDIYSAEFITRFARFCRAAAEFLAPFSDTAPIYSPLNEISFTSWGLSVHLFHCVNIGINREKVTDKHWIYYPEDTIFHRIFLQGNASPECNAPGGFGFTCEISYSPWKPLPVDGDELIARCIEDCIKVGLMTAEDKVITANLVDMPYAYVIYDHSRAKNIAVIKAWMEQQDITLAGRYSEWEYYNSDHAFLAGKKAAEKVVSQISSLLQRKAPKNCSVPATVDTLLVLIMIYSILRYLINN